MTNATTLVLGASLKSERFSNKAVKRLVSYGIPVVAVGLREGEIGDVKVVKPFPELAGIDTVTVYIGPKFIPEYYDYVLKINPRRVILNPGAGNDEFEMMLRNAGIEVVSGCTLVMLDNGTY